VEKKEVWQRIQKTSYFQQHLKLVFKSTLMKYSLSLQRKRKHERLSHASRPTTPMDGPIMSQSLKNYEKSKCNQKFEKFLKGNNRYMT